MSAIEMQEAKRYMQLAYKAHSEGEYDEAVRLYHRSLELHPTAEAHTFLGWTYSQQGELDQAIEECKNAIEIDPDFGNPYNDIGAYLIQKEQFEEAIFWLNQAANARRYEPRHYPHYNLGRVYERLGDFMQAIEEYRKAYELEPKFEQAKHAADRIQAWMN